MNFLFTLHFYLSPVTGMGNPPGWGGVGSGKFQNFVGEILEKWPGCPGPPSKGSQHTRELQEALSWTVQQDEALGHQAVELLEARQCHGGHGGVLHLPAPTSNFSSNSTHLW